MRKLEHLAGLAAFTLAAAIHNNPFEDGKMFNFNPSDSYNSIPAKPYIESRQLKEFSIQGNKIMAYSRKDAISRLKHQKKIK